MPGDGNGTCDETCWRVVEAQVRVSLTPAEVFSGNARRPAARHAFASLLMRHHAALGGVVVAQSGGLKFGMSALAPSNPASPFVHVSAKAKLLVFAPPPGAVLSGSVTYVGPDHLAIKLWATFPVVLPLADAGARYAWDVRKQMWTGDSEKDVRVGSVIRFAVVALQPTHGGIFHVNATLLDRTGARCEGLGVQPPLPDDEAHAANGLGGKRQDKNGEFGFNENMDMVAAQSEDEDEESDEDAKVVVPLPTVTLLKTPTQAYQFGHADFDDALGGGSTATKNHGQSRAKLRKIEKSMSKSKRMRKEKPDAMPSAAKEEGFVSPVKDDASTEKKKRARVVVESDIDGHRVQDREVAPSPLVSPHAQASKLSKKRRKEDKRLAAAAAEDEQKNRVSLNGGQNGAASDGGDVDSAKKDTTNSEKKKGKKRKRLREAKGEAQSELEKAQVAKAPDAERYDAAAESSSRKQKKRRRKEEAAVAASSIAASASGAVKDEDPVAMDGVAGPSGGDAAVKEEETNSGAAAGSASGKERLKERKRKKLAKLGRRLSSQFQESLGHG
jgi:DNA-directed RNA polymerase subunit E'/Rpb7